VGDGRKEGDGWHLELSVAGNSTIVTLGWKQHDGAQSPPSTPAVEVSS